MRKPQDPIPNLVPVLSRGKHRRPRQGACFMEMASYLAGERWSDRPRCTHPLLAGLARMVNDHTTDDGRSRLVPLVPSVIGQVSADPRVDARIGWRCATVALPVVAAERQNPMAVAVLVADRVLAELEEPVRSDLLPESRVALGHAPVATAWAERYAGDARVDPRRFRRISAPSIVRQAVPGIAEACVADPDAVLRDLLVAAIADVEELRSPQAGAGRSSGAAPSRTESLHR